MTAHETADLLAIEFPELSANLYAPHNTKSVYRQLDCFAAFTCRAARGPARSPLPLFCRSR
jgi:hypothetical protein